MFFKRRPKKRVLCKVSVILEAMQETLDSNAGILDLVILYGGIEHKVGISSDYSRARGFFDHLFYLDDQKFETLELFKQHAMLDNQPFVGVQEDIEVLKADEGNPTNLVIFSKYVVECEE